MANDMIFTLNARGYIFLEVMRDHFKLSNQKVKSEIECMHRAAQAALLAKGIDYGSLKTGLVPSADRHEAGFIFDSSVIESGWYGPEVMEEILPLLDMKTTQSVLVGDLLGKNQSLISKVLQDSLILSRSYTFIHGTLFFCVYMNNLSEGALKRLHDGLKSFPAYLGYIPTTYSSQAKLYLSTTLVNVFIKKGKRVIMGHEDDRANEENVNMVGYPFEKHGYEVFSIQSGYFNHFLSYKVERPIFKDFDSDSEFSLNAISNQVHLLGAFEVVIEENKYKYLISEKGGKLRKAGIDNFNRANLISLIRSKIEASYIYNLRFLHEHNVMSFNLMIEVDRVDGGYPTRLTVSLEYKPEEKILRVITLY